MDSLTEKTADDEDIDAVELCSILQCLGFNIRSIETGGSNYSQEGFGKTVVIHCQASGLHAVLENPSVACSCPVNNQEGGSGFWQISAISGGKQHDKEFGSSLLGTLPKSFRETISLKLQDIVRTIRIYKGKDQQYKDMEKQNKSASMVELQITPEKHRTPTKLDTPSRYRSLDALTNTKTECDLPLPLPLSNVLSNADSIETITKENANPIQQRQGTFVKSLLRDNSIKSITTTPGSTRRFNKTSSPIHPPQKTSILDRLITTEKMAVDICNKLSSMIVEISEEAGNDTSMSSLVLDVSKISLQKTEPVKNQYASSPNLSRLQDEANKANLKRVESASASNLTITKPTPKEGFKSKLKKISPNFLYRKEAVLKNDSKTKLTGVSKSRIMTPVHVSKQATPEASPSLSAKKKFSHVKSTIPRLSSKK